MTMEKNTMNEYAEKSDSQKQGVSTQCLDETEAALGIVLAQQYRELFQLVNAPTFGEWLFYPIKDKKNLKKTFDDVVRNTKLKWEEGLPQSFVAIAENGTGNVLCMKRDEALVYHFHHEVQAPDKVFNDLKEFIDHSEDFES